MMDAVIGRLGIVPGHRPPVAGVVGLARSGKGAALLLASQNVRTILFDRRPDLIDVDPSWAATWEKLEPKGSELLLGPHDPGRLPDLDFIVRSPGVDLQLEFLQLAREQGIPIIGELEFAALHAEGPILAITGTNGKSTTTAWACDMVRRSGERAQLAGNIGFALSEAVLEDPKATFVVETSSFQLEDARTFHPRVAALTNLTPDHLDRHADFSAYREAKLRIFANQGRDDAAVLGPDPGLDEIADASLVARRLRVRLEDRGEEGCFLRDDHLWMRAAGLEAPLLARSDLALPGEHNLQNALVAAAVAFAHGVPVKAVRQSLAEFPGLPHRLENVGTVGGVDCINDSKATNVDSLRVALVAFAEPVYLIAGGVPKGQDFAPLADRIAERTQRVYLIGEATEALVRAWGKKAALVRCRDLEDALNRALLAARPGERVLLSPGCASFDMFRDYEDRGNQFRELVAARMRREEAANG